MYQRRIPPSGRVLTKSGRCPDEIADALHRNRVNLVVTNELDVDFVPAQATCVILVAEDEAVALNTKFLRDRLTSAKNYSKPIVLVWQSPTCMSGYEAIQRIASLEFRVPVIPVSTTEDVVAFLTLTLDQEADSRSQNTITVTKKDKTSAEQTNQKLLCFVKKIPGVGSKKAQELLSRFPSLALMANATEGALTACVGPAVAHHVRTFFDSPIGGDISATPS